MSRVFKRCCEGQQSLIRPSLMVGFASSGPGPRRATSVEECTKKSRGNAALTPRACRYRGPSRQPSRLCCSGCLRTLPFPPSLGRAWWPICTNCPTCTYDLLTCTYDDLPTCTYDDLWIDNLLQMRTCLRVRTQTPMLLSRVSWSFSLFDETSELMLLDA